MGSLNHRPAPRQAFFANTVSNYPSPAMDQSWRHAQSLGNAHDRGLGLVAHRQNRRALLIRISTAALHPGDDLDPVQRTLLTQCEWTLRKAGSSRWRINLATRPRPNAYGDSGVFVFWQAAYHRCFLAAVIFEMGHGASTKGY
jgi:hypothetical protein